MKTEKREQNFNDFKRDFVRTLANAMTYVQLCYYDDAIEADSHLARRLLDVKGKLNSIINDLLLCHSYEKFETL